MDVLLTSEESKLEVETVTFLYRLIDFRSHLREILKKYNISDIEDIEVMIEKEEIEEHPAYEDYLDAITYKKEIEGLVSEIETRIQTIKSVH